METALLVIGAIVVGYMLFAVLNGIIRKPSRESYNTHGGSTLRHGRKGNHTGRW